MKVILKVINFMNNTVENMKVMHVLVHLNEVTVLILQSCLKSDSCMMNNGLNNEMYCHFPTVQINFHSNF